MKLQINITKDILRKAMMCGISSISPPLSSSCAIALAIRDLLPEAAVGNFHIITKKAFIPIPQEARLFITKFDSYKETPEKRLDLPEFSFEIEIPQEVIDEIKIDLSFLENHSTLKLIKM